MLSSDMFDEIGCYNRDLGKLFHMAGTAQTFLSIAVKMHLEIETLFSLLKSGMF